MKIIQVYSAKDINEANYLKDLFEQEGIKSEIKNAHLQSAAAEIGMGISSAPSLMIFETDLDKAKQILLDYEKSI